MNKTFKTSVVIVAAGKGTRMNSSINKQYIEIGNIPVLARTIKVFDDSPMIEDIILVTNKDDLKLCKDNIIDRFSFSKIRSITVGGSQRQESVYNGLCDVNKDTGIVLVHDGARPFVEESDIENCIKAAREYGAACISVPVKDTIKISDDKGFIEETPAREKLWAVMTPQGFQYDLLLEAHKKAMDEGFLGTDDAMLVERTGTRVKLVMGSYKNIKITTPEDINIAEAILKSL
ncbi:MAG TPA: 2-C-methyl-D-erythritol 4-phosphate cytidylyltransferase [Clostridia bacterium]